MTTKAFTIDFNDGRSSWRGTVGQFVNGYSWSFFCPSGGIGIVFSHIQNNIGGNMSRNKFWLVVLAIVVLVAGSLASTNPAFAREEANNTGEGIIFIRGQYEGRPVEIDLHWTWEYPKFIWEVTRIRVPQGFSLRQRGFLHVGLTPQEVITGGSVYGFNFVWDPGTELPKGEVTVAEIDRCLPKEFQADPQEYLFPTGGRRESEVLMVEGFAHGAIPDSSVDCSTPTETPPPTMTNTPAPSATPSSTPSPTQTIPLITPTGTNTPEPTLTSTPTQTETPTWTPTSTVTPAPSATPTIVPESGTDTWLNLLLQGGEGLSARPLLIPVEGGMWMEGGFFTADARECPASQFFLRMQEGMWVYIYVPVPQVNPFGDNNPRGVIMWTGSGPNDYVILEQTVLNEHNPRITGRFWVAKVWINPGVNLVDLQLVDTTRMSAIGLTPEPYGK